MAANKKSYDELSISEKIEAKKKKIKRLFREMPPEKRQFAEGLINQFAVTSVTLERLADEINNGDLIEDFVQGAQKLRRESPALRAYNTTITALITNLPQIIAEIVRAMPQIITGIVSALGEGVSQVAEVGANLVRGLWQGIQSLAGWLWDKVSGWISSIWDGITDFFGIHSPSTKMAWVSEMNVEGAVVGIEKNKSKAVKAYGAMGEEMLAEVDSGLAAVNDKLKSSIGEIETGFSAKATIEAVSASVPADLTGRGGGATTSGGGDTNVVNHFHIAELVVREEADVKKISRELYNMQKSKSRSKGVSMA